MLTTHLVERRFPLERKRPAILLVILAVLTIGGLSCTEPRGETLPDSHDHERVHGKPSKLKKNRLDSVSLSGRVVTPSGDGIRNTRVAISGGNFTEPVFVHTDAVGRFTFDPIPVGHWYVVTVRSKDYDFQKPSQVVTVDETISDIEFVSERRK